MAPSSSRQDILELAQALPYFSRRLPGRSRWCPLEGNTVGCDSNTLERALAAHARLYSCQIVHSSPSANTARLTQLQPTYEREITQRRRSDQRELHASFVDFWKGTISQTSATETNEHEWKIEEATYGVTYISATSNQQSEHSPKDPPVVTQHSYYVERVTWKGLCCFEGLPILKYAAFLAHDESLLGECGGDVMVCSIDCFR